MVTTPKKKMNKKPILIHSLFRTGSTYIWNKFRQNEDFCCYYEPLHHVISTFINSIIDWPYDTSLTDKMNHPELSKTHYYEYKKLVKDNGLSIFQKSFSYDEFCNNNANPDLQKYIDLLITNSEDKIPLLQFNRTSLRIQWFKEYYPNTFNIYLFRNPIDQWQSAIDQYINMEQPIFLLLDLLIAGKNIDNDYFKNLSGLIPLFKFGNHDFDNEQVFYQSIIDAYTLQESYYIFYYIWLTSLIENVCHADYLLNINYLCEKKIYRDNFSKFLSDNNMSNISFDDCKIRLYDNYSISIEEIESIESHVKHVVIGSLENEKADKIWKEINNNLIDENIFNNKVIKNPPSFIADFKLNKINKYESILKLLSHGYIEEKDFLKSCLKEEIVFKKEIDKQLLAQKEIVRVRDNQISEKNKELNQRTEWLEQRNNLVERLNEIITQNKEVIKQREEWLVENKNLIKQKNDQLAQRIEWLEQRNDLVNRLNGIIEEKKEIIEQRDDWLKEKSQLVEKYKSEIGQKNRIIQRIHSSYSYRIGRNITLPIRKILRFFR